MPSNPNSLKEMFRSIMSWRNRVNSYLESLDGQSPYAPEETAIMYAVLAIIGLLVFGAILLTGMILNS